MHPLHGGTESDLLDEVASWQADDFWQYAMYAAVAYIRAAASGVGVPARQVRKNLDERWPSALFPGAGNLGERQGLRLPGSWDGALVSCAL